ncbi:hypothetical protein FISHEDRAFT_54426 [Fistulina hepatica ATCC 64428]|uniref:HNH nuclease domain-containing protein n=1 Tax=Fistulina hepatica ATCC 64428 TaxID=1128425 RepID=A0A0D6ZZL9_9AGAR|nr:hypothetical protein FISHEDRAFT_54426 [Fistulina hepatica ATCC 64428]
MFELSLPPGGPPTGYKWEECEVSFLSMTTAFDTRIDQRDRFFGECRCVICRMQWSDLKHCHWLPSQAKDHPQHESHDGLLMCLFHCVWFDAYEFFICYFPDIHKFILINFSNNPYFQQFHGKAITLDVRDCHTPFPSLFIIHEMHVRGFYPFRLVVPNMPDDILWQHWILSDGVFNNVSGSFNRDGPPPSSISMQPLVPGFQPPTMDTGGPSSGRHMVVLNEDIIADILMATHAMPFWKASDNRPAPLTSRLVEPQNL